MDSNTYQLYINNNWIDSESGETIEIHSPWDNELIGKVQAASATQATQAIESAHEGYKFWRQASIGRRVSVFKKIIRSLKHDSDNLSQMLSKEIGKTLEEAQSEINRSIEYMELIIEAIKHMHGEIYYGEIFEKHLKGQKTGYYDRVPLGVVLAISPFNYPINLSITKIAPALIAGNSVVLKPSTQGSLISIAFYKHFTEAGLPNGVLNIVTGKSSEISSALIQNPKTALIAFTGSTETGNRIASSIIKPIPLLFELGGKDFGIVTENADLDLAASEIVKGAFSYCGQRCTAQKGALVFNSVAEELINKIVAKVKEIGKQPMIDNSSADYVMELVNDARDNGANIVLEGERESNYLSPYVIDIVTTNMRIFREEQFGPALPITRVNSEEEAIHLANESAFGLQASVYTQDIDQAFRMAEQLEVGTVQINGRPNRGPDNFPFGGVKGSGQYMQALEESIELMTRGKLTVLNRA
ncbi:aldehyde dehydrogenase family protein [Candidatus Dojkabacteria bacterium]|uniref:Aldehyde dehydrogenase family protein n=1 Tax=Candidatus Dojkabacteria bacterium TaxID=2099670 RepID=A0A955RIH1_9BACT|nr:aldehyde dehydrogenase family protein [Candidatus Dojkabacteria bacterium]